MACCHQYNKDIEIIDVNFTTQRFELCILIMLDKAYMRLCKIKIVKRSSCFFSGRVDKFLIYIKLD